MPGEATLASIAIATTVAALLILEVRLCVHIYRRALRAALSSMMLELFEHLGAGAASAAVSLLDTIA
jgi:hypothetical protein